MHEDFKYPSKEEALGVKNEIPHLSDFGFNIRSTIHLGIEYSLTIEELFRIDNLLSWNICLQNRFGKLWQTFEYMLVHHSRGISQNYKDNSSKTLTNTLLFEYYVEIFYYFYFSSLEVLAQILNLYFHFQIKEGKVSFKKIANKKTPLHTLLVDFNEKAESSNEHRNAFTHRFTPTMNDRRSSFIEIGNGKEALGIGGSKQLDFNDILYDSKQAMQHLSTLMEEVTEFVKNDFENNTYLYK